MLRIYHATVYTQPQIVVLKHSLKVCANDIKTHKGETTIFVTAGDNATLMMPNGIKIPKGLKTTKVLSSRLLTHIRNISDLSTFFIPF